jgi:hypothetical protein
MTLNEEFFRMRDIMDQLWGDLQTGDDLTIRIDKGRGLQEAFPGLSDPQGIAGTCIGTGKSV